MHATDTLQCTSCGFSDDKRSFDSAGMDDQCPACGSLNVEPVPQEPPETDVSLNHYQELCRGMREGLLITVNNMDTAAHPYDEMEVTHVDQTTGEVSLTGWHTGAFRISHDDDTGETKIRQTPEGDEHTRAHVVTSIEIVGVNDS